MRLASALLLVLSVLAWTCSSQALTLASGSAGDARPGASAGTPETDGEPQVAEGTQAGIAPTGMDLTGERQLVEEAQEAVKSVDLSAAREKVGEAIAALLARKGGESDEDWIEVMDAAGHTAWDAQDPHAARVAWGKVLEIRTRTLPEDSPDLQAARLNVARAIKMLGDPQGARALEEQVFEVFSRTLPRDHPELQAAKWNLAATIYSLDDLQGARALFEQVLEVTSRTLPGDHPDLPKARVSLAATIYSLGDLQGARSLQEQVLEVRLRTLPGDHPDLQTAREKLAVTIRSLGDHQGARALQEQALEVRLRTLPGDHPDLQTARGNLAATLYSLGDLQGARALSEQVLEVLSRTLSSDHPDLQAARLNFAGTLYSLGDFQGARDLTEHVHEVQSRTLPDDHPSLQLARRNLALTILAHAYCCPGESGGEGERDGRRERASSLLSLMSRSHARAARLAILSSPTREAEERCASLDAPLHVAISAALGYGVSKPLTELDPSVFSFVETTRAAALASADATRQAARSAEYAPLRRRLRAATAELARLVQHGTSSAEFERARGERERIERELVELSRGAGGGRGGTDIIEAEAMAATLEAREAAVGFRRFTKWRLERTEATEPSQASVPRAVSEESLCAFVVRGGGNGAPGRSTLRLVDLGPSAPIEQAVHAWREAIGARLERGEPLSREQAAQSSARGAELRRLVFDPLLPALGDSERVIVALDDVLHLVPFDALPLDEGAGADARAPELIGARWRIETRAALSELLFERAQAAEAGVLVALGGVAFNSGSLALGAEETAALEAAAPAAARVASLLRGGAWERGFAPLPYTGPEAHGVAALDEEVFEGSRALVLEKRKASREALAEAAPRARWLHVATHGWFAPESIRSWCDPRPLDGHSGLGMRLSAEEQVKGMSPMLLCGLAFAGANLPEDELGRVPGIVTAEELSELDLTGCELAVLSACDTNVGERRAGQGVASLQKALQMAGARSVITSLWKVPDEATRELMTDFYRRIWVERKPKAQALWEAKRKLREALDERGNPRYTARDWAAWVLTGEPD